MKIKIKTFKRGGIHPEENKHFTEGKSIENFPIPKKVIIPLSQHTGAPARPLVKKGDTVTEGQLIGEKNGKISANIHSPVPGKVIDVGNYLTFTGKKLLSVVIQTEGEFSLKTKEPVAWEELDREQLLQKITDAGIVGLGGAAFPTDVKYSPPPDKKIEYLIINGAECEPFLTSDDALMREKADEIIEGIKICMKILNVNKAFIGIELNKKEAIKIFSQKLNDNKIEVVGLKTRYPQGGEKQLIKAITGREVPSGGLPMDVGTVVSNVGTVYAIWEAVVYNKPLIERVVTITGRIVENPGNYKIRIGTTIKEILETIKLKEEPEKIIFGGPMMGISVQSLDVPVVKGTSGILFMGKKEVNRFDYSKYNSCIRCARCIKVCPMGLNPSMLSILGETGNYSEMKEYFIFDCIECGSCSFVCPSTRPIVQWIKIGKARLKKG